MLQIFRCVLLCLPLAGCCREPAPATSERLMPPVHATDPSHLATAVPKYLQQQASNNGTSLPYKPLIFTAGEFYPLAENRLQATHAANGALLLSNADGDPLRVLAVAIINDDDPPQILRVQIVDFDL